MRRRSQVFAFLSAPTDKKANTLWQAHHLSDISCPCVRVCHSVGFNGITGDAANHLATVVLEHVVMTDFCGIPLASLRENSITELDLNSMAVGVPGAIVLSKLLPSAAALTSLKCACRSQKCLLSCQRPLTRLLVSHHHCSSPHLQSLQQQDRRQGRLCTRCHFQGGEDHQPEVRRRQSVRFCANAP